MKKKSTKIYPRGKQILVKPDGEVSRESEFGIITPDSVEQEERAIGTVLAVGQEIKDVKKDQRVIYGAYAGEKISLKETNKEVDYILLFDEDVLAIIED
jgi:chaperonin GroES